MLHPIKVKIKGRETEADAICFHWKEFPPRAAATAKVRGMTIDDLFRQKFLSPLEWQRAQFWTKNCGKHKMDDGCGQCPLVRSIETRNHLVVLVTPDGETAVPVMDSATLEALSRHRLVQFPSFKQGA